VRQTIFFYLTDARSSFKVKGADYVQYARLITRIPVEKNRDKDCYHMNKRRLIAISLILANWLMLTNAWSEDAYPTRPIRLIVPFGAGGPTDTLGRALAERMSDQLGQRVTVENKPGAGGNIGTDLVAKAAPDGYTFLISTNGPLAGNLTLFGNLPYHPLKDFAPVTIFTILPNMLAVHPSIPANNVIELIAFLKANPNKYSFGSGGNGTSSHFSGELFKMMTGVRMEHIPYKGDGASMIDVLSGQVPIVFASVLAGMRYTDSGKIKALAVTSLDRVSALPNVPSMAEAGLTGYDLAAWYGIMLPAGTPKPIVTKLNSLIVKIIHTPDFKLRIEAMGGIPVGSTPEEVTEVIKKDIPKWAKLVKESGAKVD
jgi:tripartite-type tricarboxylate transporter receptor subunit TctC